MARAEDVAQGLTKKGKTNRGSTDNGKRLAAFAQKQPGGKADWGGCDPRWLQALIVSMTGLGGAMTFGTSRDGGAYSLTLLLDGERETLWFNGGCDLEAELEAVLATLDTMR